MLIPYLSAKETAEFLKVDNYMLQRLKPKLGKAITVEDMVYPEPYREALIVGGAGAGKTTLAKHVYTLLDNHAKNHESRLLPVYVRLRLLNKAFKEFEFIKDYCNQKKADESI